MKRLTLNRIIDTVAFISFILLITTGFLIRYILPEGSGRIDVSGPGPRAAAKQIYMIWGLTRHEWGDVHFWISVILMDVMALHLFLHWRWIVNFVKGRARESSGIRLVCGFIGILGIIGIAVAPLCTPSERIPRSQLIENRSQSSAGFSGPDVSGIKGRTSLKELEQKWGVPALHVIRELRLPENTSVDQGLGHLRREHGFQMDDVRRIVKSYKSE